MSTNPSVSNRFVGLMTYWQLWLAKRVLPRAPTKLVFAEQRKEVLNEDLGIDHDVVAAYADSINEPDISLKLPVDRRCYFEELPPELIAIWTEFVSELTKIDREGRVAWGH